jgi:hypothetical protein
LSGQETSWVVLASTLTSHISRSSLLHVCLFVCSHTIGAMSPTRDVVLAFDTINHWTSCQDLHPVEHCASRRRSPRPTSPFSGGATLGEIEGHRPPAAWTTLTSVESLPPHTLVRESPPPPPLSLVAQASNAAARLCASPLKGMPSRQDVQFIDHSLVLRTLRSALFVDIDRRANGASQRPHHSRGRRVGRCRLEER